MSITFPFSGVARSFLQDLSQTRKSLHQAALRLKDDAHHARSWGFFGLGTLAAKVLHREQDDLDGLESRVKSYAERAVEMTHFLDDPDQIAAVKAEILEGNMDGITVEALDRFILEESEKMDLHAYDPEQREAMITNARQHASPSSIHCPSQGTSDPLPLPS